MSDTFPLPLPPGTPATIEPSEIDRFFQAVWKNQGCEICGQQTWVLQPDPVRYSYVAVGDGSSPTTMSALVTPCLTVACVTCGNAKFLFVGVVKFWLSSNPIVKAEEKPNE